MNSLLMSLLHFKAIDDVPYSVIISQGPFELRMYQKMTCAKISLPTSYEEAHAQGTRVLEDYLDGNNFKVSKINHNGTVFQIQRAEVWEVGLILPINVDLSSLPKPINRNIKIQEIYPGKVAALSFKGEPTEEKFFRRGSELKRWLQYKGIKFRGPVRIERHDPGLPLSLFKHNEVQLDVQ